MLAIEEKKKRKYYIKRFLQQHRQIYDKIELQYLHTCHNIDDQMINLPDIFRQLLDELNLVTPDKNVYTIFCKFLEELYGLDRDIIEVGGGVIPSLGKKIALKQQKGSITVYDPRLMNIQTPPNLVLKREQFTSKTNLSKTNLLIGFTPKEATETIINEACKNNIDFIIVLCCLGIPSEDEYYEYIDELINAIIRDTTKKLQSTELGELHYTTELFGSDYPVIYTKKGNLIN